MTFSTPKDDLETYNKLNEYYDIADDLNSKVVESNEITFKQKQEILYPIIEKIKNLADNLTGNYIILLKDEENIDKLLNVRKNIENILEEIDFFKNKIYEIYRINKEGPK